MDAVWLAALSYGSRAESSSSSGGRTVDTVERSLLVLFFV